MELSEVIFDLGLVGSTSHINYDIMVANWIIVENNFLPSLELCIETWNNVSLPRLTSQRKQERILEVKAAAGEILRLNYDWKVIKQYTTEHWTPEEFFVIKQQMQAIRNKSNEIEQEILAINTLDEVNNYIINFND